MQTWWWHWLRMCPFQKLIKVPSQFQYEQPINGPYGTFLWAFQNVTQPVRTVTIVTTFFFFWKSPEGFIKYYYVEQVWKRTPTCFNFENESAYLQRYCITELVITTTASVAWGFCTSTMRHKRSELHYKYYETPSSNPQLVYARHALFIVIMKAIAWKRSVEISLL